MSKVWYEDPDTGELYQDRIEKGRTVRVWGKLVKEASRAESSTIPRDRRQSVLDRPAEGSSSRRQREKSTVRESIQGDRRPSYTESDQAQHYPEGSTRYADEQPEEYYDSNRQASTSYQPRDDFDSAQPRHLSPRPFDPGTRDPLTESFDTLRVSGDEHYTHSPRADSAARDWQPPFVSVRHDETTFLSSERDPSRPAYSSHDYDDEQTPAVSQIQQQGPNRVIKGTPGPSERIDSSYKVRTRDYKTFFRVGRVFSTLWTDALGNNAGKVDPTFVSEVLYGERVYSKIRRFIVVREGERSVSCLPVTSYANEGIRKSGIRLDEHGFIYSKNKPKKIEGMCSRPLKLSLAHGAAHLKDPSLVNYGKVYNVETNVKVKNVGTLDSESEDILLHYFRKIYSGMLDPGGAGITPRASEAVLFGVGAALNSYPPPIPAGSYTPVTASESGFTTASTVTGYPPAAPTAYRASSTSGGRDAPSVYYPPSSQHETSSSMSFRPTSNTYGMDSAGYAGPNTYSVPSMHAQTQYASTPFATSAHGLTYTSGNTMDSSRQSSTGYYQAPPRDEYYPPQGPTNSSYSGSTLYPQTPSSYPATTAGSDFFLPAASAYSQAPEPYPPQGAYNPRHSTAPALPSAIYEDDIDLNPDPDREAAIVRRRRESRSDRRRR